MAGTKTRTSIDPEKDPNQESMARTDNHDAIDRQGALMRDPRALKRRLRQRRAARDAASDSGAQIIEPDRIEHVPSTAGERERLREAQTEQELATRAQQAEREHVAGMVKVNIVDRLGDAKAALEQGIEAFEHVVTTNPSMQSSDPGILGAFGASVIGWLKGAVPQAIDRYAGGVGGGIPLHRSTIEVDVRTHGLDNLDPLDAPISELRELPASHARGIVTSALESGAASATGGAVQISGGTLAVGSVGSSLAVTMLVGDYLDSLYNGWLKEQSLTTMSAVTNRLRSQVRDVFDVLVTRTKFARPDGVDEVAEQLELTKPLFQPAAVSDFLHVLFLEKMQPVMTGKDYLDAVHSLGARQQSSRAFAEQHGEVSSHAR